MTNNESQYLPIPRYKLTKKGRKGITKLPKKGKENSEGGTKKKVTRKLKWDKGEQKGSKRERSEQQGDEEV